MANLNGFNANNVEPAKPISTIPSGEYEAVITESEMKPTKAGTGQYLQLTFEITKGEYQGRKQWARLNLDNPSDTAVQIAKAELSAICRAVGVLQPQDSQDLHDIPLVIVVKCKKGDDGEIRNEIAGYKPVQRKQSGASTQQQPAKKSPAPWAKKTNDDIPY